MKVSIISFTQKGADLASQIARLLNTTGDEATCACGFGDNKTNYKSWTSEQFNTSDALVFVGACGIAVRAIAPHVQHKTLDPAVVVVDELGQHAISLLSGHIGGGNKLTSKIAQGINANAVITTATDVNNLFAVDTWAASQNMCVINPEKIKRVSSKILSGGDVSVWSEFNIDGQMPAHLKPATTPHDADVIVSVHSHFGDGFDLQTPALLLAPKILVLGIGCKRGTPKEHIQSCFLEVCKREHLNTEVFCKLATIDIKANEEGLCAFARDYNLEMCCFDAASLKACEGQFHSSSFVEKTVGVDNVCERSVVAAGAKLIVRRYANNGVTIAIGQLDTNLKWILD